jgi:hypothetical protein
MKKDVEHRKLILGKLSGRLTIHIALDMNNSFTHKPLKIKAYGGPAGI